MKLKKKKEALHRCKNRNRLTNTENKLAIMKRKTDEGSEEVQTARSKTNESQGCTYSIGNGANVSK